MTDSKETAQKKYLIPEIREPTLFDFIVEKIVPEIFKFAEYCSVAGFILFVAIKTNSMIAYGFAYLLYGCVYFHTNHVMVNFVKKLEFKTVWRMRIASWVLLLVGVVLMGSTLLVVLQIASAQVK